MSTEDTTPQGGRDDARGDTTRQGAPSRPEPREEQHRDPRVITEADRAANPIGVAKREREQRERDDAGRFAKGKDDQQQAKPDGKDGGDKPANQNHQDRQAQGQAQDQQGDRRAPPPPPGIQAERDRRQTAEREVEQLRREMAEMRGMMMARQQQPPSPQGQQQPDAPPEFWQDPNAAMDWRLKQAMSPVERQMQEHRLGMSRMFAVQTHGAEKVQGAIAALSELRLTNPSEFRRLDAMAERSDDPVGDVVRWHIQSSALQRYGADPEAYVKAEVERRIAELQGQQQAQQHEEEQRQQHYQPPPAQRPPVQHQQLPTAFAAQRGGGPRGGEAWGGPRPLSEITRRG